MKIYFKSKECINNQMSDVKSNDTKVLLQTNLVTPNWAQHGEESQQVLIIHSSGRVTLTRYFWLAENRTTRMNLQIASGQAEKIINMIEQVVDDIKPSCYLLDRGTVVITVTENGATKHGRIYLNSEIMINGIDVNYYIKKTLNLPEAVVFGTDSVDCSCLADVEK